MDMSAPQRTPLFSSRLVGLACCREYSVDYQRRSDSQFDRVPSSSGMSGKQACDDGPTANHGVRVGCLVAS